MDLSIEDTQRLRRKMLNGIVDWFCPDAIILDHLPCGKNNEMLDAIVNCRAKKYLILRGVVDTKDVAARDVFSPVHISLYEQYFDAILIAGDRRICDVACEYDIKSKNVLDKITYIGYISDAITESERASCRYSRGIPKSAKWVVCTAGGGAFSEAWVREYSKLALDLKDVYFDIVWGPRSSIKPQTIEKSYSSFGYRRVSHWLECQDVPLLHASADIVICSGGYNSLVEVSEGRAHVLCAPIRTKLSDEQWLHVDRLRQHFPIEIVDTFEKLRTELYKAVENTSAGRSFLGRNKLDFNGLDNISNILRDRMSRR